MKKVCFIFLAITGGYCAIGQHSIAREWNEVLLNSIRLDFAKPPVHARNLWQTSMAMYDAWAVYDKQASTFFLGKELYGYNCPFTGTVIPEDIESAREEAMSYAVYRLIYHRFKNSPGAVQSLSLCDSLMNVLGYDISNITLDYTNSPAGVGNYIATFLINYGYQDGSNEAGNFTNLYYKPVNPPLVPDLPGNPTLKDPYRWQQLTLDVYIDQNGHVISGTTPPFQSPEWGLVHPFALDTADLQILHRDSNDYWVYHLPEAPPALDTVATGGASELYKWNFELVANWASHLSPFDTTKWDISPASMGNVTEYPEEYADYLNFYKAEGGDPGIGYSVNPITNLPYQPQFVKRGDYTRVLAEFWADGPNSETPPGHWFTILNYVSDHPMCEKKFKGEIQYNDLEWDVKSYFTLGGALHDAAITAWGIKGYVDYIRPISAIRYMADLGQSSDVNLPSYHPGGMRLKPGLIELVALGDSLEGPNGENIGKVKIYTWKGHEHIQNPATDIAGAGWILAENWWPYQRPTFVTPPFAGFISGHSTYSSTAAEVLSSFTGDEYFPGGIGHFFAEKDKFLHFEKGPSQHVTLQWAKYRDASDQCSLSRIWGGIHPPADDILGRIIGRKVGEDAFDKAEHYFYNYYTRTDTRTNKADVFNVFPNPVTSGEFFIQGDFSDESIEIALFDMQGKSVNASIVKSGMDLYTCKLESVQSGLYVLKIAGKDRNISRLISVN